MVENLQHWRKINPMLGSQLTSALENVSEGNWLGIWRTMDTQRQRTNHNPTAAQCTCKHAIWDV